jgi:hypothetical protein
MISVARILRKWFILSGKLSEIGGIWPAYLATLPDDASVPANIAALYDTTPDNKGKDMRGNTVYRYGVQIHVRSNLYPIGYAKILELNLSLGDISNTQIEVDGIIYTMQNASASSGVLSIGMDEEKKRFHWTVNLLLTINEE